MRGEGAHQVRPTLPVARRRHDRVVAEHGLGRVGGKVVRHERQLDDGAQADLHHRVVDPVDTGEVVHGLAVDLAVDP
jgi:hypothetical protein